MRTIMTAAAVASLAMLGACASDKASGSRETKTTPDAAIANAGMVSNSKCPIMPDHLIDPAVTVAYKGKKVGFCCAGCIDEWDKMSESKKNEMLAKAR